MDHIRRKVVDDIATHGWHVIKVLEDESGPGFAYTIGLFRSYGHPEVIAFGLLLDRLHGFRNLVGDDAKSGRRHFAEELTEDLIEGYQCAFIEFPERAYGNFLGQALAYYDGERFPALQFVWPDKDRKFPWESGVDPEIRALQPTPGRLALV